MKHRTALPILASLASFSMASGVMAVTWNGYGVHGGSITESGGQFTAVAGNTAGETPEYHWNKSSWATRTGEKAFYVTSDLNGMPVGAITEFSWDFVSGYWGNAYFNIMVEDGGGKKAILAPKYNGPSTTGWDTTVGSTTKSYCVFEAEAGWTGTATIGWDGATWDEVKVLTITDGPFTEFPDTLAGTATGQGDPAYTVANWAAWADQAAGYDADWEKGGVMVTFGQSTGAVDDTTVIENFQFQWLAVENIDTGEKFATIQEAIDDTDTLAGHTIEVAPGTFEEQVVIGLNDLHIIGSGSGADPATNTIIQSPTSLTYYFDSGTKDNYPIVGVHDSTGATIENLRIDGLGRGNGNYRFEGVAFWNAGGGVIDCAITGIRDTPLSGSQHGVGIYAYNDTSGPYAINVTGTDVDDYQKNGMSLLGTGVTVSVTDCTATGAGSLGSGLPAQNGIQIGAGAGGSVDGCTISDHMYSPGTWAATGLLLLEGGASVAVTNTVLTDNQPSVYCQDTDATFDGLDLSHQATYSGDGFYAYNTTSGFRYDGAAPRLAVSPFGDKYAEETGDRAVMTATISNSTFVGHGAAGSWGIGAFATGSDLVDLTVTTSTVTNWDSGIVAYDYGGPVDLTASNNQLTGNVTYGFENFFSSTVMNATMNYWGDPFGPDDPAGVLPAINGFCFPVTDIFNYNAGVNGVTDESVEYCPWLTAAPPAPATVTLNTDDVCYNATDSTLMLTIDMTGATVEVVGGQFFLEYDETILDFVSMAPGSSPFTEEVYESVNETAGTIDYAVGVPTPPGTGTLSDTTMAVITFGIIGEICDVAEVVKFRSHTPPSRLTDDLGTAIYPSLANVGEITIDQTPPVISGCPTNITVNADAGDCTAVVSWTEPTAADTCCLDTFVLTSLPSDTFPSGSTLVTYTATDCCGNVSTCEFYVNVDPYNEVVVDVDMFGGFAGIFERCITFEVDCVEYGNVMEFDSTGSSTGSVMFLVPCGVYDCITARDKLHTLRQQITLVDAGTQYNASFTGTDELIAGNLNDDDWIDILDFGIFVGQFGGSYGSVDTDCSTPAPHADVTGDDLVNSDDYSFIQINFLDGADGSCAGCPFPLGPAHLTASSNGPITRISVRELRKLHLHDLIKADLNRDGWLDVRDMEAFAGGARQ